MENQETSYCVARTLQERMLFFESEINEVLKQKQHIKRNVGYFNAPLMELDRQIAHLRTEQKRVYDLMTGAVEIEEAEYEIIN